MQETLRKLEHVQEIDLQINTILKKKAAFPSRIAPFDEQIRSLRTKIDEKNKVTSELEKTKRQNKGALELNEDRSKRTQEKMSQLKNTNEFTAFQKEVDGLKKNAETISENNKKVEEELSKHNAEVAGYQKSIDEIQAKIDQEASKIAEEEKVLNVDLADLEGKRKSAIDGVDKRVLSAYDRIRVARQGIGLAIANSGGCRACHMKLPPQMYNELLRANDVMTCPSCKRILVVKNEQKASS